jgi:hypothetical protein
MPRQVPVFNSTGLEQENRRETIKRAIKKRIFIT